ncbi:hypothetical protein [Nocardia sp. NPDC050710]|uniref:hypothetical protein n=1 Tax=Nocardia sp. NPDC050710 TaxID=3157220 RepID=UPI0033D78CE4
MAEILSVDIDVLDKAVQSLRNAEHVLSDAMKAMAKGGHGDIGTTVLNNATDTFQQSWKFGIERIGESAKVTGDGISAACDAYKQLDEQFAKALEQAKATVDSQSQPQ